MRAALESGGQRYDVSFDLVAMNPSFVTGFLLSPFVVRPRKHQSLLVSVSACFGAAATRRGGRVRVHDGCF